MEDADITPCRVVEPARHPCGALRHPERPWQSRPRETDRIGRMDAPRRANCGYDEIEMARDDAERLDSPWAQASAAPDDPSSRKVAELTESRDTMLEEVERARAELGLRERRLGDAEAEHVVLQQQLGDAEKGNRRLQREVGQLLDRVFEQEDLLARADPARELRRELDMIRGENARLRAKVLAAGLTDEDSRLDDESALADELSRALSDRDEARSELAALEEQLRRMWAEMEVVARDLDTAREDTHELADLRREHLALESQIEDMQRLIEELRAQIRELHARPSTESYEAEMAIARELLDGLERQCERAESRAAAYKLELIELRAVNAELRKHLSAFGRRVRAAQAAQATAAGRREPPKR
jgi:chromosome segregation ATPase